MGHSIMFDGELTPEHAAEKFIHLPFQVPEGAVRLSVKRNPLGDETGHLAITKGLFDTRGSQFLTGGFRGWAAVERDDVFVSPSAATPGFMRGPLQPGEWTLVLTCPGELRAGSLRYSYTLDVDVDAEAAARAPAEFPNPMRDLARAVAGGSNGAGGRWYRGDLHAHSEHSDGKNTVGQVVDHVRRTGLDFFALTDHNTISHWEELARLNTGSPLLIGGEEVTMPGGHANVWGIEGWVDFRIHNASEVQQLIEDARARGSMFSVNHPYTPTPWRHDSVVGYQGIEVWNSPWRFYNEPALIHWQYDLNRGKRVVAVGGSDSHWVPPAEATQPNLPGEPCTWVYVEGPLTQRSVLDAVERGRVFISQEPAGPFLEMRADADGSGAFAALPGDVIEAEPARRVRFRLKYRGPEGNVLRLHSRKMIVKEYKLDSEAFDNEIELPVEGKDYVRAEVRGYRGRQERGEVMQALTNPIYWGRWTS